jgi:CDP-glucose 4,6-dehydratase
LEAGVERLIGVDRAPGQPGSCWDATRMGDDPRVSLATMDIRDHDALRWLMADEKVDIAIHLAAMAIVGECNLKPWDTYSINVMGTVAFLEAVRLTDVDRCLVITTDKVYRDKDGLPWTEDDDLVATGPYAVSKACADQITRDYWHGYLKPAERRCVVGRAGNVLAPGDTHRGRIFVDVVMALAENQPPLILNPAFTRPYTFVGDTISGYLSALAQAHRPEVNGEPFNFGPREATGVPNGELAQMMCDLWGSGVAWQSGNARPEPFRDQSLDCAKADRILGWRPTYTLRDGLTDLVSWSQALIAGADAEPMRAQTADIIRRHASSAGSQGIWWAQD